MGMILVPKYIKQNLNLTFTLNFNSPHNTTPPNPPPLQKKERIRQPSTVALGKQGGFGSSSIKFKEKT